MSSLAEGTLLAMQEHAARQLIETIRVKHSTVAHEELAEIVTSLLYMTSSDLYEQSTHCILELLQNADDNRYDANILPTLTFTFEPGGLRVDCNEHGFKANHVEAISTVRHSTKSGSKHSHGYTGEKGIGFKSVYRIADEVWISSRQYRFKFEKYQRLGMIAPVWADFPRPVIPGVTSFFLKLAEEYNQEELVIQLKDFDPRLLLFLRRVRRVCIKVLENDGYEWSQDILKEIRSDGMNTTTTLDTGSTQQHFATFEHHVKDLPPDPRRLHISSSALSFALPIISLSDEPMPARQQVFALLPIREYGLKFLLNGDFILTASRSNIDESLPWNQRLRDGLADGFLAAVGHFNGGPLKYSWPFYVPNSDVSCFFLPARHTISTRLHCESVLESSAASMARPSSLVYVHSDKYADSSGKPFTLCPETASRYLSAQYPQWTIESVISLGVSAMSDTGFLEDLTTMIENNASLFRTQNSTWHEELSKALLPLTQDGELREKLVRLPIIPLHDGTWTSSQSAPVFFADDLDPANFPRSIGLSIVDPAVSRIHSRKTLLQALGIMQIDSGRLCQHIADAHASKSFHPERFTRAELISHAIYLFKSSWTPPDWITVDLWFATSDGGRCKGSQTYIRGECDADSAMARVFNKLRNRFSSVHDNYFLAPTSNEAVQLADSLASPFATYSVLHLSTPTTGLVTEVDETDFPLYEHDFERSGEAELVFDIDDEFFAEDSLMDGQILLTKSPTLRQFQHTAPAARTIHDDYTDLSRELDFIIQRRSNRQTDRSKSSALQSRQTDRSKSSALQSWRQYMIKTLHLSAIPRLVSIHKGIFGDRYRLSKEFKFLFRVCLLADVLQLLNEHWTTYAEWLELSAEQQKSHDAITANKDLLEEIGAVKVMGHSGQVPLREMVLPELDTYVDAMDIPLGYLQIGNSRDDTLRRRLACFGVAVTNDLHYYLISLQAVSHQASPEHDILAYLYEQIQSRFLNDENAVHLAFEDGSLIYMGRRGTRVDEPTWWTIQKAMRNQDEVLRRYPACRTMFLWLLSSATDDISALIKQASSISTLWPLQQILDLLIRISTSLDTISPIKVRLAVKPLGHRTIFPVRGHVQRQGPYDLASAKDQTWFIADHAIFKNSFEGVAPLLAITASDLKKLNALLGALNLETRKLSELCTRKVFPSGETHYSARDTRFFQKRSTSFFVDLIPQDLHDRDNIRIQLENAVVMVAPRIVERYIFRYMAGPEYVGHAREAKIAFRVVSGGKDLHIFTTSKDSIHQRRLFPLLDTMAEHCGIKDSTSLRLLDAAINESRTDRIHSAFADAGYLGHDSKQEDSAYPPTKQRHARRAGISRIYSNSSESGDGSESEDNARRAWKSDPRPRNRSGRSQRGKKNKVGSDSETSDRRLPLLKLTEVGHEEPSNPIDAQGKFLVMQTLDPNRHLEYYGEKLLSETFKTELKGTYYPEFHWTSELRVRAGLREFEQKSRWEGDLMWDPSPFTLADEQVSDEMVQFLLRGGLDVAKLRTLPHPTFCIEIAVSGGNRSDPFVWSTAQLRRIQNCHLGSSNGLFYGHIMLLFHISNVYSKPTFEVFVDPWELMTSNRLVFPGETKFRTMIKDFNPSDKLSPGTGRALMVSNSHPTTTADLPTTGISPQTKLWPTVISDVQLPYQYVRLARGEIRLFLLFPGQQSEHIRGMLLTVPSIKDAGNFRALSYEWGDRKKEREIFTESGVLKIWGSLHKAILTLRGKQNATVFWIDAICINQVDDSEKIQQIRLLPQIFQQASRTIAFLGSDRRSDDAIETLLQIRAKLDKSEEWPKELKKVPESWQHESKPRLDDPIWQDIKVLFDRTWFRRAWIVQEAVASLTVTFVCGKWTVDWEDIHLAMEIVQQKPHLPNDITASWAPFSTLSSLRELETRQRRFSLFTLLDKFHYMNSTLKRDHFFALLGLASDGDEDGFSPRYGSIPFVSIAVQYGETLVKQGKGAHLLRRAGIAGRSELGRTRFPSWLPDLTARPRDRLLDLHDRGIMYNASKGVKEDISGRNILKVNGCIFDDIIEVSKHSNGQGPKQWVKYFAEIDDMINALHSESLPEYRHDLKVQVPIAGALSLGELSIEDSYTAFRQSLKKARFKSAKQLNLRTSRAPMSKTSSSIQTGVMTMQEKGRQYEELLKTNIAGWRFITTKRKHCGIAPNGVRVGDVISVIGGCDVPFVMRGSRRFMEFRLIAGCYVHGMMKGEASKFSDVNETYFLID